MVCDPSHRCCSSSLQEDCIPLAWPSQTLYYARLRDNFIQMCKYARDHTMSLSWNALMTTTSQTPPVQLNQQNFAAWTPPRGQHTTPFPWQRRGRQNLCYIATSYLLTFYIYTPPPPNNNNNSWTWTQVEGERVRFFISTGRQQQISSHSAASYRRPLLGPHVPPKNMHQVCVYKHTNYICMSNTRTQIACEERDLKEKYIFLHILYVPLVFPFHSALSIKNILTQKPVSIKVSIPWTFKDKPYLITGALTTEI